MPSTALKAAPLPTTLLEYLKSALDAKLASLPDDQARYRHLILTGNVWQLKYDAFRSFGTQPFNAPHPAYGPMDAWDFSTLLADIDARKTALEKVPA